MTEFQKKCENFYYFLSEQIKKDDIIEVYSSGTTGIPKKFNKKIKEEYEKKRGYGSEEDIWLLTYSIEKWSSISVFLHCIKNNSKVVFPKSLDTKDIADCIKMCTHISMTPSLFRKIIMFDFEKHENIKQITFGGEYANQEILNEAKKYFPKARISHVYASSEIGDICSSSDGKEGYYISQIKNSFFDNGELIINGKKTNDIWNVIDGRMYFVGRKEHILNVGGETINLREIEEYIIKNSSIKDGKYKIINAPIIGTSFVFEYVGEVDEKKIKQLIIKNFSKYHVPLKFTKVDEILLGDTGKKVRK